MYNNKMELEVYLHLLNSRTYTDPDSFYPVTIYTLCEINCSIIHTLYIQHTITEVPMDRRNFSIDLNKTALKSSF